MKTNPELIATTNEEAKALLLSSNQNLFLGCDKQLADLFITIGKKMVFRGETSFTRGPFAISLPPNAGKRDRLEKLAR